MRWIREHYETGELCADGWIDDAGRRVGEWRVYDEAGRLLRVIEAHPERRMRPQ